jgi:hypothetical protein
MPEKETLERARRDKRQGKSKSTQAGEFVREEIHHVREGKHGARSAKQAIGLNKARRAGVDLPLPEGSSEETRESARSARSRAGKKASPTRSRATRGALKREGTRSASKSALARQAKSSARKRGPASRKAAAKKAARTRRRTT